MAELGLKSIEPSSMPSSPGLVCRLRQQRGADGAAGRPSTAGEVELENTSAAVLEFDWQLSPLQYLDLVVTNADGDVVSQWHYGDSFSPIAKPATLRLGPGERFTANVSLLGNVPEAKRLSGRYTIRAVFGCKALQAVSDPIQIQYS